MISDVLPPPQPPASVFTVDAVGGLVGLDKKPLQIKIYPQQCKVLALDHVMGEVLYLLLSPEGHFVLFKLDYLVKQGGIILLAPEFVMQAYQAAQRKLVKPEEFKKELDALKGKLKDRKQGIPKDGVRSIN